MTSPRRLWRAKPCRCLLRRRASRTFAKASRASVPGSADRAQAAARPKRFFRSWRRREERRVRPTRSNAEHAEHADRLRFLRALRLTLVAVSCLALTARVGATVVIPADVGELARDARTIVRGRVAAVDARWTEDRRTIESIVTLEVEGYLKGALGQTLQFRTPGGELGRFRSVMVGAPEFSTGERVVVFLGAMGPAIP